MTELRFQHPGVPTSVNHLYIVKGGRKILSSEGRKYKNEFVLRRGGVPLPEMMNFTPMLEGPYELELWFFLSEERCMNLTFGTDKRVKSPYADIDTSNMIKLVEDCISAVTGIRDRNNFSVHAHKRVTRKEERVVAYLRPMDPLSAMEDEDETR